MGHDNDGLRPTGGYRKKQFTEYSLGLWAGSEGNDRWGSDELDVRFGFYDCAN